jgi:flagellar protein FlgJ
MSNFPTAELSQVNFSAEDAQGKAQLENLKRLTSQGVKTEKEIEKAAGGFEALLLHQMLQSMWKTVDSTGLLGENSNQAKIYHDMFQQALADTISEGDGIGVKKFLRKELSKYSNASKE